MVHDQFHPNLSRHTPLLRLIVCITGDSGAAPGMMILPCSIKTISSFANSYTDNLIDGAAGVSLKEGHPLVLEVRKSTYHPRHLRLRSEAFKAGAIIFPPVPEFYIRPGSVEDLVDNTMTRILVRLGSENDLYHEWQGRPAK